MRNRATRTKPGLYSRLRAPARGGDAPSQCALSGGRPSRSPRTSPMLSIIHMRATGMVLSCPESREVSSGMATLIPTGNTPAIPQAAPRVQRALSGVEK